MALIRDADLLSEDGSPSAALLRNCIGEHKKELGRLKKLHDYYYGDHDIKNRTRSNEKAPNNKLVCNHAEYIVDMSTGYFLGNPVKYKTESIDSDSGTKELDITPITDNFKDVDIHSHDVELDRDRSIYGIALELPFATDDESPIIDFAEISPEHGFLVIDDTVKHKSLFGVNYYPQYDVNGILSNYVINVYTSNKYYKYKSKVLEEPNTYTLVEEEEHYFGMVPFIEYKNKKSCQGDFEQVISLIDAYNVLQSDRVNDKEQFVNAILVVIGASFGDDSEEVSETVKTLRDLGVLELPHDAQALYLQKAFDESSVEILKKSLKDDIHEFSKVPCLSDANFASTDSGVALAYKLLAFEMLIKQKENFFRQGLKQRLKLMCNFYNIKGFNLDPGCIDIEMSRSLPINRTELINMVVALEGHVSDETRLSLLDFIDDPKEELKKLKEDLKEKIKQQQEQFGSYNFKQASEDGEVDEEE
nr:phage portal protein [uncultured Cellulosilyticum sp.]